MKFVTDLSKGILSGPDSEEMWNEILDNISDSLLLKPGVKILNIGCGHGTEAEIIAKRMKALGVSLDDINDSIYLIDKYRTFINHAKTVYGFKNAIVQDFITWETNMKFDVVVGNPPYQDDSKGGAKRWPLWMKFVEKSIEMTNDNGAIALISPSSWLSPNDAFDVITKYDLKYVNLDVKKYFNVGSTFSSYVIQKSKPTKKTTFVQGEKTIVVDWSGFDMFPNNITEASISLMKKFYSQQDKFKMFTTSSHHSSKKELFGEKSKVFRYEIFHTEAQTLWSNVRNPYQSEKRVLVTLSGNQRPFYTESVGGTATVMQFPVNSEEEGENLVSVLNSKLYKKMTELTKYSGFALKKVWVKLPKIDIGRKWSDKQLYKHFKLTDEEIAFVESTI